MTGHEHWDQQAAGYALDALTPEEAAAFADHLAGCSQCRRSVDEHLLTAAHLGAIAHDQGAEAPPWSALRDAVYAADTPAARTSGDAAEAGPGHAGTRSVTALDSHRHRRVAVSRRVLAAAAGVIVLAAAGVTGWRLSERQPTSGPVASCRAAVGCHVVALRSPATGRTAATAMVAADGRITMVPTGMSPAPAGRTYVLWQMTTDGRPRAVAAFRVTSATAPTSPGAVSLPYRKLIELAVSVERAGPLPASPSHLVAVGTTT